jgi:hypothetical protein
MPGETNDDTAGERWSLRGVPKAYQQAITEAAMRDKMTAGAWVCRAADVALRAEREPRALVTIDPPGAPDTQDGAGLNVFDVIDAAIRLAEAPSVPARFRARANRVLLNALPAPSRRAAGPALRLVVNEDPA